VQKYLHNSGPQRQLKKELLTVNGLVLCNGKQSEVKATSLITLQFIHIQRSTLPAKLYSVFSLINTSEPTPIA